MKIGIIGAGAAGLAAALSVGAEHEVVLFDANPQPAKKILSTGNGRCNLSNRHMDADCFRGDPAFAMQVIHTVTPEDTALFFEDLGIYTYTNEEGYVYPRSLQASAVSRALWDAVNQARIPVRFGCPVTKATRNGAGFSVQCGKESFWFDRLILACGSNASNISGSDGSGYVLADRLGHKILAPVPALTALNVFDFSAAGLDGVRAHGSLTIREKDLILAKDTGELQFTSAGISGIPAFQVSRFVSAYGRRDSLTHTLSDASLRKSYPLPENITLTAEIDLFPEESLPSLEAKIQTLPMRRAKTQIAEILSGLIPSKLSRYLVDSLGLPTEKLARNLTADDCRALAVKAKHLSFPISGTLGFDRAQVSAGGVDTSFVDPLTLESTQVPGLFFAGEILNVDGICGGYNLQFAFSGGILAGRNAGKE